MEYALSIVIGIALSATAGFRVFVPFLVISAANLAGWLELTDSFAWIGTYPALVAFAVATVVEILAYFIPWVDNVLNAISVPASLVAGTVLTYAFISDMGPGLAWFISVIAGGGASLLTRAASNVAHAASTTTTGGTANPVLSFFESLGTFLMSIITIIAPFVAAILLLLILYWAVGMYRRLRARRTG
jgi:hypothetical protein